MSKYLGIDSSTQSITGLLIDVEQRAIVAEASINFDEHFKTTYGVVNGVLDLGEGVVHSAPLMWVEALDLLLQTLADQGQRSRRSASQSPAAASSTAPFISTPALDLP